MSLTAFLQEECQLLKAALEAAERDVEDLDADLIAFRNTVRAAEARAAAATEALRQIAGREWRDEGGRIAGGIARDGLVSAGAQQEPPPPPEDPVAQSDEKQSDVRALLVDADAFISHMLYRGSWPGDRWEVELLIGNLRRAYESPGPPDVRGDKT